MMLTIKSGSSTWRRASVNAASSTVDASAARLVLSGVGDTAAAADTTSSCKEPGSAAMGIVSKRPGLCAAATVFVSSVFVSSVVMIRLSIRVCWISGMSDGNKGVIKPSHLWFCVLIPSLIWLRVHWAVR